VWHARIFSGTSPLLILATHVLLGLVLSAHGLLLAAPFARSPQLAAVVSTGGAIGSAILALVFSSRFGTGAAVGFSLVFPGGFYVFAIRCICGWENHQIRTDALKPDPDSGLVLLPILLAGLVRLPFGVCVRG
jgi:ATP-binding cassette subfamily A (ABC1) protein 3